MPSFADQGLAFVDRCAAQTAAESAEDFLATAKRMGFAGCACGAWAGVGKNRRHQFFFVDWPQDWLDFYNLGGWFEHDRVAREARTRTAPYLSSEFATHKVTAEECSLFDAGQAYGWKDVFAVPIHGPGSLQELVTMGTRETLDFTSLNRAVLEMMGRAVWERCRSSEFLRRRRGREGPPQPSRDRMSGLGGRRQVGRRHRSIAWRQAGDGAFPHRASQEAARGEHPRRSGRARRAPRDPLTHPPD